MNSIYIKQLFFLLSSSFLLITLNIDCETDKTPISPNKSLYTSHDFEWEIDTLHAPDAFQILMDDIWGTREDNVWVVGHSDVTKYQIWHWDGNDWKNLHPGIFGDRPSYREIIGFSEDDIWIVGDGTYRVGIDPELKHREYILHFDGFAWRRIENIKSPFCLSVWGDSSSELFVGCDSGVVLYNSGNTWQKQFTGTDAQITSIWGFDSNHVFAAGYSFSQRTYYFFQKSENGWEIKDSGNWKFGNFLWGVGISHFYSVGGGGLYIYKDNSWQNLMSFNSLSVIYGNQTNNIFAGGFGNRILHYNGIDWHLYNEFENSSNWISGIWCNSSTVFLIMRELSKTFILKGKVILDKSK